MEKDPQILKVARKIRETNAPPEFQVFCQALSLYLTSPEIYATAMKDRIGIIEDRRVMLAADAIKRRLATGKIITSLHTDPERIFDEDLD